MRLKFGVAVLNVWAWRRRGRFHQGFLQGLVRRVRLGLDQRRGAIVLVVFRQVGLGIIELWNFELVDA